MRLVTATIGAPEILIVLLIFAVVGLTIWGLVDAIQRKQTGWWVGILVAWFFSLGWLVSIIYLLAIRPGLKREQEALDFGSAAPPPSTPPPPPPDDIIS